MVVVFCRVMETVVLEKEKEKESDLENVISFKAMSKMHPLDKRCAIHCIICQLHISYTKKMYQMYY